MKEIEKEKKIDNVYAKNGKRRGTNIESGARRRIFGVWPCSMGSARVDYLMHHADGTHRLEGTLPFGLELVLFLLW